jgi:hypothetical protein
VRVVLAGRVDGAVPFALCQREPWNPTPPVMLSWALRRNNPFMTRVDYKYWPLYGKRQWPRSP